MTQQKHELDNTFHIHPVQSIARTGRGMLKIYGQSGECDCGENHAPPSHLSKQGSLGLAMALLLIAAIAEAGVGWWSHSLALVAESVHALSDGFTLALASVATIWAQRPASDRATFGYRRVEVLAALIQALGLMAIACWIGWEAVDHLRQPSIDILGTPMVITAAIAFGVNTLNAKLLHPHSHQDLNLRGAFFHLVADAASAIGVMLAAIAIRWGHWFWADGAIGLLIAGLMLVGGIALMQQTLPIVLEQAPTSLDLDQIRSQILQSEGVVAIDRLRVWTVAPEQNLLTADLTILGLDGHQRDRLVEKLQDTLHQTFDIHESYLQLKQATPPLNLSIPSNLESLRISSHSFFREDEPKLPQEPRTNSKPLR